MSLTLSGFIDTYKDAISKRVVSSYPPLYHPSESDNRLPKLLRRPLGGQTDAIRAASLSLKAHKGTIIVGEMGTGKTFIGTAAAYTAGFKRTIVLCPPHLTRKWKREVEDTIPKTTASIVTSITDLNKIKRSPARGPHFVILSRERAKLSYRWKPAHIMRWATAAGRLIRDEKTGYPFRVPCCPTCYEQIVDKDGIPLTDADLTRKRRYCDYCRSAIWHADNSGPKRYPLADYIKRYMKDYFELFIGDEVHEYKARGSAQGIAAGVLAESCKKSLTLTGTLTGGYSSTLFHLLYRFSPAIRNEFSHNAESRWINRYGFVEKTIYNSLPDTPAQDGRMSRRKSYRTVIREKPGLSPSALFHLIPNTIFLRLADVASDLPTYEENILLSDLDQMEAAYGYSQRSAYREIYSIMRQALSSALVTGSKRLLGAYLQTLLAYPDGCTRGESVFDPKTGFPLVQIPPLPEDRVYPKEKALLDLIAAERLAGRKVLVYITHTSSRDITTRVSSFLTQNGIHTAVLKSDTVKPDHREAWVQQKVAEGIDVLICHPRLVQTGLDLIDFPTITWFETEYSVYTMRQASRRSWRIGQTRPVNVLYMAYRGTLQADALKLVAQKLQSSLAVEGELPEDGLAAYGDDGDDLMMALARSIVNGDEDTDDKALEEAFTKATQMEYASEEYLVDDDWYDQPTQGQEPDLPPATQEPAQQGQQSLFSWAEFLVEEPPSTRKRHGHPQPSSMSLFQWAIQEERQPVAAD